MTVINDPRMDLIWPDFGALARPNARAQASRAVPSPSRHGHAAGHGVMAARAALRHFGACHKDIGCQKGFDPSEHRWPRCGAWPRAAFPVKRISCLGPHSLVMGLIHHHALRFRSRPSRASPVARTAFPSRSTCQDTPHCRSHAPQPGRATDSDQAHLLSRAAHPAARCLLRFRPRAAASPACPTLRRISGRAQQHRCAALRPTPTLNLPV
jgi:hypothetical protein